VFKDSGTNGTPVDSGTNTDPDGGVDPNDTGINPNNDGGVNNDSGTPNDTGVPPTGQAIGEACANGSECASNTCLTGVQPWWETEFLGGYCSLGQCSDQNPCPAGSDCFIIDNANNTTCLQTCATATDCGRQGYDCFEPGACLPEVMMQPPGTGTVGDPCMVDNDCADPNASCVPENGANGPTGWTGGYCVVFDCSAQAPCPSGSECFTVAEDGSTACLRSCSGPGTCGRTEYACLSDIGACIPACTPNSCGSGEVCDSQTGLCGAMPCTPQSCQSGTICDSGSGQCVIDVGNPPPGPVPTCNGAPAWQCSGGESFCGQIIAFEPDMGTGYWDYNINGEGNSEYRSYIRRDVMMMVQYAAWMVDCLGNNWTGFGNQQPLGLGDMSESNGAIPGTSIGQPGHPAGTHVNGRDMDIAYYQLNAPDNTLRPICDHVSGGQDQQHCIAPPDDLDVWRTALFLGLLHANPQLRVIGVDGQAGPLIDSAITQLCGNGWLNTSVCGNGYAITYETTDMGRGWYYFHHHHFHISFTDSNGNATIPNFSGPNACLVPDCRPAQEELLYDRPIRRLGAPFTIEMGLIGLPR
jgi:hypothetical protein